MQRGVVEGHVPRIQQDHTAEARLPRSRVFARQQYLWYRKTHVEIVRAEFDQILPICPCREMGLNSRSVYMLARVPSVVVTMLKPVLTSRHVAPPNECPIRKTFLRSILRRSESSPGHVQHTDRQYASVSLGVQYLGPCSFAYITHDLIMAVCSIDERIEPDLGC